MAWTMRVMLAAAIALMASPAQAQTDLLAEDVVPLAEESDFRLDPIGIELESFGAGGLARPGEWAAVRLVLTENTNERREVIVRIGLSDADGDTTEFRTVVSTNPGIRQPVTLYVRLPAGYVGDPPPTVGVYEAIEGGSGAGSLGYREGSLISQVRLPEAAMRASIIDAATGSMLLVGNRPMGLLAYSQGAVGASNSGGGSEPYQAFGHELTRLASGVRPADLPDRWYGLSMYREVVWSEGSPLDLSIEQVRALREWVQRGGHLVIVLPAAGNEWLALENQELASMLPRVLIERRETQPIEPYVPLLVQTPDVRLTQPITVHVLDAMAEAESREAMPVLAGPDGRTIVSRRLIGNGAVTLIGLDLTGLTARRGQPGAPNFVPQTSVSPGIPEADVFWHRILGRRGALMSTEGMREWDRNSNALLTSRTLSWIDADFGGVISLTGRAATGVLLGIVVFALYWLVAGPGGFFGLKRANLVRHAWLAFVVAAGVFTALAWGGALAIKPKTLTFDHLTFLDHVYGERVQRTRTVASILVPAYGQASVEVGTESELAVTGQGRYTHIAAPWEPTDGLRSGRAIGFPDSRGYAVDTRSPSSLTFPARSTVKQVSLDWLGGMDWQGIRPQPIEGEDVGVIRPASNPAAGLLEGILRHDLPGALTNVRIVVVTGQTAVGGARSRSGANADSPTGTLLARGASYALVDPWAPGEPLRLDQLTRRGQGSALGIAMSALTPGARRLGVGDLTPRPTQGTIDDRLVNVAFFGVSGPPVMGDRGPNMTGPTLLRRAGAHTLDLSRWFTQPCVIVVGILDVEGDEGCPTPFEIRVNGQDREPRVRGRTVVRWVYPLEPGPPGYQGAGLSGAEGGPGSGQGSGP